MLSGESAVRKRYYMLRILLGFTYIGIRKIYSNLYCEWRIMAENGPILPHTGKNFTLLMQIALKNKVTMI